MNPKPRKLILLLCFCMLLPVFNACANKTNTHTNNVEKGYYDDSSRERASDTIPDDYNLNGATVTIFYNTGAEDPVMGYEDVVDIVYSKIYERNERVENRLGMKLAFKGSEHGSDWNNIATVLSDYLIRLDDTFQIVMTGNNVVIQHKLFPYFHDLNDSEYIDIDEEWYYKDAIMELSVDYFYYRFIYGDIHISDLGCTGVIFYNKDLFQQYINPANKDLIYDLVLDGTWTLDQFYSMTKKSNITKGGNGENDIHGYSLFRYAEQIHHFANSCGVEYYSRSKNGIPQITIYNDRSIDFANQLYKVLYENEGAWLFYPGQVGKESEHGEDFMNNKVMFLLDGMNTVLSDSMREMESDFGIVPYPKWDELQEEYISLIHNSSTATGIPITVSYDDAMNKYSAVLEALSSESYRSVMVPYFETALKNNYSRDDIASQMLDIITGHHDTIKSRLIKNFLYEYSSSLNSIGSIFSTLMSSHSHDFASQYDSISDAAKTSLNKLIADYLETSEESPY